MIAMIVMWKAGVRTLEKLLRLMATLSNPLLKYEVISSSVNIQDGRYLEINKVIFS